MSETGQQVSPGEAFIKGAKSGLRSVFFLVLMGTYVGVGALAHDFGFSIWWLTLSTVLVWAAPAQVIMISLLGTGAALIEVAIAVTLSAVRLFPMVVALLPLLRDDKTPTRRLLLATHATAISMWVESLRLLPALPKEQRIPFCNGLSAVYISAAIVGGVAGFYLAASLPPLLGGALLFLTPLSFLLSTARNAREMIDRIAFGLGLALAPVLTLAQVSLDLMWTGIIGGTVAYGIHRFRAARA